MEIILKEDVLNLGYKQLSLHQQQRKCWLKN